MPISNHCATSVGGSECVGCWEEAPQSMVKVWEFQCSVFVLPVIVMTAIGCEVALARDPLLECEARQAVTIVVSPSIVISDYTTTRNPVSVLVVDGGGSPVCFRHVRFSCMDPETICFPIEEAVTGADGRAFNYLEREVSDPTRIESAFRVAVGPAVSRLIPIRGSNILTEGTPTEFKAPELRPFGSQRIQLLRGSVATFIDGMPIGSRLGGRSIDPTVAEIKNGIVVGDPDPITGRQPVEFEIVATGNGVTTFLIDTLDHSVYHAEIVGTFSDEFIRGDCDSDGVLSLSDSVRLLAFLFHGDTRPSILEACNVNDDVSLDLSDAVYLLTHLFLGGRTPPAPFPGAGEDPTP